MLHWVVADEELVDFADIHPPTFGATCPSSPLAVYAERGLFSAEVNWTEPAATDNSGILPTVTSNHQPLQRFNQGTHVITYTAVDQSGNTATCNFTIDVIGKMIQILTHMHVLIEKHKHIRIVVVKTCFLPLCLWWRLCLGLHLFPKRKVALNLRYLNRKGA